MTCNNESMLSYVISTMSLIISRLKHVTENANLQMITITLWRCYNVIGGSLPKAKLNTLQRLQDRARSIIANARQKDGWSHNWLTVEQLIKSIDQL